MPVVNNLNVFRELADVLPFGVTVVALDGTILYWNRAAERIRGYLSHEVVGRCCGQGALGERCQSIQAACAVECCPHGSVLREAKPVGAHVMVSHRDGHRLPVRMQAIPMHDDRGAMVAVAEIFTSPGGDDGTPGWLETYQQGAHSALGLPNADASEDELQKRLLESSGRHAVFLVGIANLDEAVRRCGSGIRTVALRSLAQSLVWVLSPPYFLGSWTGDNFLLLVPGCCEQTYGAVLEKLQRAGNNCVVTWWGDRIGMQVSASGTITQPQDTVASVMKRLEHEPCRAGAAGGK